VIAAAVDAGVEHLVYTSIIDVSAESGFYYAAIHRETEALLAESGLRHGLARTSIFADYFVSTWLAPALEEGALALPAGSGRMSLVTRADVARAVAFAAATRREEAMELTGPEALTADEISRIAAATKGRSLRYLALDDEAYRERLARAETPDWLIEAYSTMFNSVREGRFELVSGDIPRFTGERQHSFAEFLRSAVPEPA
jgi:NAD(P)H dehydrogenase (quinone)